jgi:cell wall-associated NlpC family hydrolase
MVISEDQIGTLISQARLMIRKVPWRHQGRSLRGVDCIGLFHVTGKAIGLDIEMKSNYTRQPDPRDIEAGMETYANRILVKDYLPGDFALIRYGAKAIHVVMFTNQGIIHCSADSKTVIEHSIDDKWKRDIVSVWRLKGRFNGG